MMVAPHEARAAAEVIGEAHQIVHDGIGGHGAVVAAVLDGQTDPGCAQACMQAVGGGTHGAQPSVNDIKHAVVLLIRSSHGFGQMKPTSILTPIKLNVFFANRIEN